MVKHIVIGLLLSACSIVPAYAAMKDKDKNSKDKVTVVLSAPAVNANYTAPAEISLAAEAFSKQAKHPVVQVEFYQGTALIGTATAAPFTTQWVNVAAGDYVLTARATNAKGDTAVSDAVPLHVNAAPAVVITAPANHALYASPAAISFTANATDADGTVQKVDYYQGATLIGTATTAPYTVAWSNVASGNYVVTARATDNKGGVTTSAAINVSVDSVPTISIASPANHATFDAPATITLTANAADSDGTISKVEYFTGTSLIGIAMAAPYTVTWANVASGTYVVTAKATDNKGQASTSAAINVSVNGLPTVAITSPANNATFLAPTSLTVTVNAADTDGAVTKVEFFNNGTLIAQHIGTTSPYTMTLDKPAAGTYVITAQATDDKGGTTVSSPITFTVNANQLPTVSLTGPTEGQTYLAPASITLSATANDTDGTVQRVELYQGATLLATLAQPPYTYEWKGVAAGNYTLFAKAIDNLDGTSTSSAIHVTVNPNAAPSITLDANPPSTATPGNVMLSANATDTDGTIAKVAFYNGSNLLATVTQAPFAYNWLDIPAGTYTVTARATDNGGMETTSNVVTVTVAQGPAQAYYIHADHLNTPRLITDQAGNKVWEWENSDPFGANAANEDPQNTGSRLAFNLRFPGQYFDKETGLHYNYFRDYDPATGRYVQSDPIGLRGGLNTYTYVEGNPISLVDPDGLCAWCLPAAGIAAACFGVAKFFDSSNEALKAAEQRQKMQNEMQEWIKNGMKGKPPYSEGEMQQSNQKVIEEARQATADGAKVTAQPLVRTGSILKHLSK